MLELKQPRLFVFASALILTIALSPTLGHCRGPAISVQGTVLVPLRAVFDSLGATTAYNKGTITATRGGTTVSLTVGSKRAMRNGTATQLAVAPRLLGTQTYVPLRFVGEAFGAMVGYDAGNGLVTVSGGQAAVELYVVSPAVALACDAYSAHRTLRWRSRDWWPNVQARFPVVPISEHQLEEVRRHYPMAGYCWFDELDLETNEAIRRMEGDARFVSLLRRYGGAPGAAWSSFSVERKDAHGLKLRFSECLDAIIVGTYGGFENPSISSVTEWGPTDERQIWSARVINGQWRFTKTATYSS